MGNETQFGTQEKKCQTYEANGSLYGSNAIGQTLTVKEEIGENSPTLKEETGNTWVCYATDLLKASSSTDLSGNHVSSHNNVPSNEEKAILHESNSIESQYESRHMMTVKEDIREDSHALKEEIGEDPLTSKETTGEFWNHLAAGLLNASSSADVFGSDVPPHDRLLSDEEKVLKILHATDVNLKKEHEKQSAELPEQCVKCGRHYASKFLLQRHLNCDHLDEGFTCGECGRNYRILRALNKHKQVIHRKHLFMCSYEGCDHPGYKCHAALTAHIRSVHTQVRPYACETCGKAFVSRHRLRVHSIKHTSERPFHCKCGLKFRHHSSLYKHRRLCLLN